MISSGLDVAVESVVVVRGSWVGVGVYRLLELSTGENSDIYGWSWQKCSLDIRRFQFDQPTTYSSYNTNCLALVNRSNEFIYIIYVYIHYGGLVQCIVFISSSLTLPHTRCPYNSGICPYICST